MEKPTIPGLRCVLLITANRAAKNMIPLPRNSRFVASHLQAKKRGVSPPPFSLYGLIFSQFHILPVIDFVKMFLEPSR